MVIVSGPLRAYITLFKRLGIFPYDLRTNRLILSHRIVIAHAIFFAIFVSVGSLYWLRELRSFTFGANMICFTAMIIADIFLSVTWFWTLRKTGLMERFLQLMEHHMRVFENVPFKFPDALKLSFACVALLSVDNLLIMIQSRSLLPMYWIVSILVKCAIIAPFICHISVAGKSFERLSTMVYNCRKTPPSKTFVMNIIRAYEDMHSAVEHIGEHYELLLLIFVSYCFVGITSEIFLFFNNLEKQSLFLNVGVILFAIVLTTFLNAAISSCNYMATQVSFIQ